MRKPLPIVRVMDSRCPLGLKTFPTSPCPLATERLRALRNKPGEPETEVGCEWYVNDRSANYCFFKYVADHDGKSHETIEIASLLHSTQASVYDNLKKAIAKVKDAGVGEMILGEDV